MGTQLPPKMDTAVQFSAHVRCGKTAGWIKISLDKEVGLGLGDFVLDEDPVPPPKKRRYSSSIFNPCLLWRNIWMDQDATWYGGRPRPRPHCVRCWQVPSPWKGHSSPLFLAHAYCGQTVADLSYCWALVKLLQIHITRFSAADVRQTKALVINSIRVAVTISITNFIRPNYVKIPKQC